MAELTKKEKRELAKEKKKKERRKKELNSRLKRYLIYAALLGILGYFGYKAFSFITAPTPEVAREPVNVVGSDWIKGSEEAEATLIEYGDFQCPACATYYPLVKQLLDDYPDGLRVVYRHFPLSSHKYAYEAALASEAAGIQGKFWDMHNILFERQDDWVSLSNPEDKFVEYAEELELDSEKFHFDYGGDEVKGAVDADILSGNKLQVNATPTFYLNGRRLGPIRSYDEFSESVEEAINENGGDGN